MHRKCDLVVMDWGIGGLSVQRELARLQPELSHLYFSDSGFTPYGKLSSKQLTARLKKLILGFADQGVHHVVIACNAASTVLPLLQKSLVGRDILVTGVIAPGVELIRKSRAKNIGVIGGRRTIQSRSFTLPFRGSTKRVRGRVAQPLSALIEAGELDGRKMQSALNEILMPLKTCDALLLACTHYCAVQDQIQKLLPDCELLDPANLTAQFVKKNWKLKARTAKPHHVFMTSGSPQQMRRSARAAFGIHIGKIQQFKDQTLRPRD